MTTTLQKTPVSTTWNVTKIQDEVSAAMMRNWLVTLKVVEKFGPEAVQELNKSFTTMKIDYYKAQGVKTPIDLVKAMAEFETNVFGSKMTIWGDEKQAVVEYQVCGCYNAMVNSLKLPQAEIEKLGKNCAANSELLAKEFGMKVEMKFGTTPTEPCCTMTFTK
jgi:hypothetical protein